MKVGITVDHTKFVEEFPLAVKKLMRFVIQRIFPQHEHRI